MQRCLGLLLLLALLQVSSSLRAEIDEPTSASRLVVVVADPARGPALSQLFAAVVQARLPDVHVRFVPETTWSTMPVRPSAELLFHLDTSRDAVWTLRLVQSDRAWQRRLRGVARDPAAIEAAALIAARASVALLTREDGESEERPEELTAWTRKDMDRDRAAQVAEPEPAPKPPTAAPRPALTTPERDAGPHEDQREQAAASLQILGAYRGAPYARGVPWTHGAHLGLSVRLRAGPCAALGYTYTPAVEVRTQFGDFEIARYPAELHGGWCFRRGPFGVSPTLGVLVEPTRRRAAEPDSGVGVSSSNTSVGWAAVTALAADWGPSESLRLYLGLSAAYFASDLEYVAAGSESPLFSPYQVRLRVDVGAEFAMF